jgi:hypothetical protein
MASSVGVPHFAFPPVIGGDKHLAVVEQDSEEDVLACVYVALKTPLGSRYYVPNFGVDDFTFAQPVPISELQDQIQTSEPRATPELSQQIQDLVETVVVGVGNVG